MGYSSVMQPNGQWLTWVPAVTGFTTNPTVTAARYTLSGKTCHCYFRMTQATSNATTLTVTLPFAAANTTTQIITGGFCVNNGTTQTAPPRIDTATNSVIANCYLNSSAATWTASNAKGIAFNLTYEIA